MKALSGFLGLFLSVTLMHGSVAAVEPSTLSLYKGKYAGTVIYASVLPGNTTANFSASRKKDVGVLTLTSTLNSGGTLVPFVETFHFHKKTLTSYTIQISTTSGSGSGTVHIGKKTITYSGTFVVVGQGSYSLQGTIRKSKRSMTIAEQISGGSIPTFPINYSLKLQGKQK